MIYRRFRSRGFPFWRASYGPFSNGGVPSLAPRRLAAASYIRLSSDVVGVVSSSLRDACREIGVENATGWRRDEAGFKES